MRMSAGNSMQFHRIRTAQWVRDAVEEEIDWNTWRESEERVKEEREKIRRALEQSSGEMDGLRKKGSRPVPEWATHSPCFKLPSPSLA